MSSSFAEVLSFEVKSEVKPVELVVPVVLGIPDLEVKTSQAKGSEEDQDGGEGS